MSANPDRHYLYVLTFTAGFTTLGVELSASRLLDPWFGNSLFVWASLIGLILLYLSLGYWLGGRIADRAPRLLPLLRLTAVAALGVGLVPVVARPVLLVASRGMADFDVGLIAGSMAAVLVLFAAPVTLLGCVSPYAVRLMLQDVHSGGAIAGRLYALSTAGSILGSFLPVLLLVPNIGTRRTFAVLALALLAVVLSGLARLRRWLDALVLLVLSLTVGWLGLRPVGPIKPTAGLVFETESAFNYIQVLDLGSERQLRLNEGEGIHSVYRPQGGLADGIWDYFLLAPAFNPAPYDPQQVRRLYIGGLAAGTIAQLFTEAYGPIAIDGAELDPAIIAVGRAWFDMNQDNLNAVAMDARRFLAQLPQDANGPYDLIAVDAYRPPYIPFHLTTVEFFALARDRLTEQGVVAVNVGRTTSDYSLVDAIATTMQTVFSSVYVIDEPVGAKGLGNSLVVASKQPTTLADLRANLSCFSRQPLLAKVADRATPYVRLAQPRAGTPIFTDDRAPVEQVVHGLVIRYLLGR
ncbi:MAG: spermidine synthase [Anaerolineae bacterium]